MSLKNYDIAIVGGGIVGLTTALALAEQDFSVLVTEPKYHRATLPEPFDARSYALTQSSIRIFDKLGVWELVDQQRNAGINNISVWDAESRGYIEFSPRSVNERSFGVIIENANLLGALQSRIEAHKNIQIERERFLSSNCSNNERTVTFETGRKITTRLLVGCDGGDSPVRHHLGISATQIPYRQSALVCNVKTSLDHQFIARQIFRPNGPLAFLPLAERNQSAIVWTTSEVECAELCGLADEIFNQRISAAFDHKLGACEVVTGRFQFTLQKMHAKRYDAERAVLVGDAAHIIHPLAGQGLNLGLLDAAALADVCRDPAARLDHGILQQPSRALRRYSRWRTSENSLMLAATDGLNLLFQRNQRGVRYARGLGLRLVTKIPSLMRLFTHSAMGSTGEVPSLAAKY